MFNILLLLLLYDIIYFYKKYNYNYTFVFIIFVTFLNRIEYGYYVLWYEYFNMFC